MMVYQWKPGAFAPVSAQIVGEELNKIQIEKGRFFKPADVVAVAKDDASVLHPIFEWNDIKAAARYREDQAKYIIRNVVIINQDDEQKAPVRAFVSVVVGERGESNYTTLSNAMSDDDFRAQILRQADADIRAFEAKYARFMEVASVVEEFKKARGVAQLGPGKALI
jgi:hypothetical protein